MWKAPKPDAKLDRYIAENVMGWELHKKKGAKLIYAVSKKHRKKGAPNFIQVSEKLNAAEWSPSVYERQAAFAARQLSGFKTINMSKPEGKNPYQARLITKNGTSSGTGDTAGAAICEAIKAMKKKKS